MSLIRLDSYECTGARIVGVAGQFEINGDTVFMHRPFVSIGNGLAIAPAIEVTDRGLLVRTDLWTGMAVRDYEVGVLPVTTEDQGLIARITREFDQDPEIAWDSSREQIVAWCEQWAARQRVTTTAPANPS
ncbi:hypothetical protein [Amycolatopsis sp. PS_44_ISF1]|uniref:hypothetical protein n=1 Tax=Amycolatopsis sp. PS_44_ISF1 TaxID=2974917 RepID=UPI0028DE7BDC|nr:hypothetical protein [Amycolatopsis sp. PS_44_ISF1]MDT8916235.1 hypothetical protein [Amycolatopsis sp. PS_44_ISF1]